MFGGGLASSWRDREGFTWDIGGHVQFSHYDTFDRYMDEGLGREGWLNHQRESWVWTQNRFVPYPFQNNLHRLDPEERWNCVKGLLAAEAGLVKPAHFGEWMESTFGSGITELFMKPYNFKVWAYPPNLLDYGWIGERVSIPPLETVLKSICTGEDEISWGPNQTFRFPLEGGTGSIWKALGDRLPQDRVRLKSPVRHIDGVRKQVETVDGKRYRYRYLLSTIPLNHLIRIAPGIVKPEVADAFVYSSTHIVGVGLSGQAPEHLRTKCWIYFPESNSPYYRVTVFSHYSPNNCPHPGEEWSLMTETSESPLKPVEEGRIVEETLRALREDGFLPEGENPKSVAYRRVTQGYPTPWLGRDAVVDPALRAFEERNIYSRGRFGAWKYEVANQDHCFAQGYECVERLVSQGAQEHEPTLHRPAWVNGRRNP